MFVNCPKCQRRYSSYDKSSSCPHFELNSNSDNLPSTINDSVTSLFDSSASSDSSFDGGGGECGGGGSSDSY